jgi:hypothetical protein
MLESNRDYLFDANSESGRYIHASVNGVLWFMDGDNEVLVLENQTPASLAMKLMRNWVNHGIISDSDVE